MQNFKMNVIWTIFVIAVYQIGISSCGNNNKDFQFVKDDVTDGTQLIYTETETETPKKLLNSNQQHNACPYSQDKIMLSLILRDRSWDDIVQKKRDRVINKLAKFFILTKDDLNIDDITKTELFEMSKYAINRGKSHLSLQTNKKLGRLEFLVGCNKQLFHSGKLITNQIGHQMKDGSINDISGLDFGWWVMWTKHVNNRTPRVRRQLTEGSGEEEEDDYYYDDDDDDDTESITIQPVSTTTTTVRPHRHHHGKQNSNKEKKVSSNKITSNTTPIAPSGGDQITDTEIILGTRPSSSSSSWFDSDSKIKSTTMSSSEEREMVQEEVSKLEETIMKTIENAKEFEDVIPAEEVETRPRYNFDFNSDVNEKIEEDLDEKSEFDDIIEEKELRPIVKTILENSHDPDKNRDYIIEDVSTGLFTEPSLPSSSRSDFMSSSSTTSTTSAPVTTFDTISTSSDQNNWRETTSEKGQYERIVTIPDDSMTSNSNEQYKYDEDKSDNEQAHINSPTSQDGTTSTTDDNRQHNADPVPTITSSAITFSTSTTTTQSDTSLLTNAQSSSSSSESPFSTNIHINNNNNYVTSTIQSTDSEQSFDTTTLPAFSYNNNHNNNNNRNNNISTNTLLLPTSINVGDSVDLFSSTTATTSSSASVTISTHLSTNPDTVVTTVDNYNTGLVQTEPTIPSTQATTPVDDYYDEEYDDTLDEVQSGELPSKSTEMATTTVEPEPEERNTQPMLRNRLPKTAVTAGKWFKVNVSEENFYDAEDGTNLRLDFLDKNEHPLKANSWIQFNPIRREIYGLPLEEHVSRYRYLLRATDSGNESVTEDFDISVQQHKGHRSVNHEIEIQVRLNEKFEYSIDWQLKLIDAIYEVLGDTNREVLVVREIRSHPGDLNGFTFVYTNETLPSIVPKDACPVEEVEELVEKLHIDDLNMVLNPQLSVKSVKEQLVGNCKKSTTRGNVPTNAPTKNFPPVPRNQVDRVNATVGQLLVYRVPLDTFYDPEDENDLKLSLLTMDRQELDPHYWLQFDSKNREFYGIPKPGDSGRTQYLLVAKDRGNLTATDALEVVVNHSQKRDYGVLFDFNLGISYESFNRSSIQRRFIEQIGKVFGDSNRNHILVRQIRRLPQTHNVAITFYNTTLHRHHRCPTEEIEELRSILLHPDSSIRDKVKDTLGTEFHLQNVNLHPIGACQGGDTITHEIPVKADEPPPHQPDDYLLTFVLPAIIILAMLLLASIIACVLHRRRLTGKMELGDEEERKSFRSKGIPVIFQDELDEKPEMGTKSPIILKDEKPPLLPPSYNQMNPDEDDMDEYVPPPGVGPVSARESRGKSPVTPSYRKPPPYVSP
uniref:Dystroglycan 1 n=1 Tax=Culicoides sonorensis TaxID=179676 RepID=A0A336M1T5_CULSO